MKKMLTTNAGGFEINLSCSRWKRKILLDNGDMVVKTDTPEVEVAEGLEYAVNAQKRYNAEPESVKEYISLSDLAESEAQAELNKKLQTLDRLIEDTEDLEYIDYLILVCPVLRDTEDLEAEQLITAYEDEYGFKNPF